MDLQKTLTNAWRRLAPRLTAVYDELINAQNTYNNMSGYDKYRVRENAPKIYNQWIQKQINALEKDYQYAKDIYDDRHRYIQHQRNTNSPYWLAGEIDAANYWYTRYNDDNDKIKELEGKKLATNKERADFIPTNSNPLKEGDKQWTIDDLMWKMELMVLHDDYMRSIDKNYKASKEEDEEWNGYKKQLKDLWVSFDDFRDWYYKQHPTPQMEARDKAWEALNNAFYNTLWPSPAQTTEQSQAVNSDAQIQEAKRLVTNELKRMNAAWELTKDIYRAKKLIDLYKKLK